MFEIKTCAVKRLRGGSTRENIREKSMTRSVPGNRAKVSFIPREDQRRDTSEGSDVHFDTTERDMIIDTVRIYFFADVVRRVASVLSGLALRADDQAA